MEPIEEIRIDVDGHIDTEEQSSDTQDTQSDMHTVGEIFNSGSTDPHFDVVPYLPSSGFTLSKLAIEDSLIAPKPATNADYVLTAKMLSNTRLQNFLIAIDNRTRLSGNLSQTTLSHILEKGIEFIVTYKYFGVKPLSLSHIFNTDFGSVVFMADGFHDEYSDSLYIVRFTREYKSRMLSQLIDDESLDDNYIVELSALAALSILELDLSCKFSFINTIHDDNGEIVDTVHSPGLLSIDSIKDMISTFASDMDNGELPPECEDKWTTGAGVHSRCEKYCSVKDICPFYKPT